MFGLYLYGEDIRKFISHIGGKLGIELSDSPVLDGDARAAMKDNLI